MSLETFESMGYGPIGDAVIKAEPHTEADPVGVYAAILALWSSAINGPVTMADGRPVVVWTVLVGESALGRKGTALRVSRGMLKHSIEKYLETRTAGGVTSGPSLTRLLYERQEETEGTEGGTDTRTLIIDDEWSENLRKQRTCPTYSGRLRKCWDAETIRNTTTREALVVPNPRLGLHAHISPGEWSEYVKPRDAKGGSYNRLLPVLVEGSKVLPYGHREQHPEIQGLREAYEWSRVRPRSMQLSRAAARRFDELRAGFLEKMLTMPDHIKCYVERTPEQIIRVAAVLTAAECRVEVSPEAIDAAWTFVQYSTKSVESLVREDASKASSRVIKSLPTLIREILRQYEGEASSSILLRRLGMRATAASLRAAVESMDDVEVVKGQTATGKGRRPDIYHLVTPGEAFPSSPQTEPVDQAPEPLQGLATVPETSVQETRELSLSGNWL